MSVRVVGSWELPDEIAQPEGSWLLDGLVPLVADDRPPGEPAADNVLRLEALPPRS